MTDEPTDQTPLQLLQQHLLATSSWPLPFPSAGIAKTQAASYLKQYRRYQWLAASRGLLRNTIPRASDPLQPEEFPPGCLEEDDELVLDRVRQTQFSIQLALSELDSNLARLERSLLSRRQTVWVRTGAITLILTAFLAYLVASSGRDIIRFIPRSFRPHIPLIPSPIAVVFILAREAQISAVAAARARVERLVATVASSHPVSRDEIAWLRSEKWEGVDWGLIGL